MLRTEGVMHPLQAIDELELTLIDLEFAAADFIARKASINKPNDLETLVGKLAAANRMIQISVAALGASTTASERWPDSGIQPFG